MVRAFELAEKLVSQGKIRGTLVKDLTEKDLTQAREVMLMGTTLDVLPVGQYEGQHWTSFTVSKALREMILDDQKSPI